MKINGFAVSNVKIEPGLVLAPMSGVTCTAFRRLIKELNGSDVGLLVTEFISIEGLTRQNLRTLEMMRFVQAERPISVQIFGHDIQRMADAAKMVEDAGADIVDINSGCPVPKVVRRGGGCELMRQSEHMAKLLSVVSRAVSIPLTLKIRSGWDEQNINALEIAKIAEDSGVKMLAVHGRTRAALYRGLSDWELIGEVAKAVSIPVIGSGDVVDVESATKASRVGVSGLMIGRGALYNPWIFSELATAARGQVYQQPSAESTVDVLERYRDLLRETLPDKAVIGRLKQLTSFITRRVIGSSSARKRLCQSKSVAEFSEILISWRQQLLNENSIVKNWSQNQLEFSTAEISL